MLVGRKKYIKKGKKFDYYKKEYSNPFFHQKKRKKIKIPSFPKLRLGQRSWRVKLIIVEIMVLIVGLVWFFCFSSFFLIGNITVAYFEQNHQDHNPDVYSQDHNNTINRWSAGSSTGRISTEEIKELAWQQTKRRRFLFGSQENLILFNKNKLIKTLSEQCCFDDLVVEKNLPDTLVIKFKEKTYSAIWYEQDKYYYIDAKGNIITETNPLEINQKNYPLIENVGENKILNKKIEGQEENINYIILLFNEFKKGHHGFEIERFIIDKEIDTVKMAINHGPEVYFNTSASIDKQVTKLLILINEKLKDDFSNKTYIDLRYGDRVYYR